MPQNTPAVSVGRAQQLLENPTSLVVDVRTPGEFHTAHIPESINIPVDQLDPHLREIVTAAGGTLLLVCQSGGRAEQAAGKLGDHGYSDMVVLAGGMGAWQAAGGPVVTPEPGQERWSLERQVRLVAGSIVFVAVIASLWVPWAIWFAAFIGGGLAFAALTNTCMMGMLLAKLPYNRGPGCDIDGAIARLRQAPGTS